MFLESLKNAFHYYSLSGALIAFAASVLITIALAVLVEIWLEPPSDELVDAASIHQQKKKGVASFGVAIITSFFVCPVVVYVLFELGLLDSF